MAKRVAKPARPTTRAAARASAAVAGGVVKTSEPLTSMNFVGDCEAFNRADLLRQSIFYEFPHTIVQGFVNPFTIHTLLKHALQNLGYKMQKERYDVWPSIVPRCFNITLGLQGRKTLVRGFVGSGGSQSMNAPSFPIEFWISGIGSLYTSNNQEGEGLELKIMLAANIQRKAEEPSLLQDFETIRQQVPQILQVNHRPLNWAEISKPVGQFREARMDYIAAPDIRLPSTSSEYNDALKRRFPLKYKPDNMPIQPVAEDLMFERPESGGSMLARPKPQISEPAPPKAVKSAPVPMKSVKPIAVPLKAVKPTPAPPKVIKSVSTPLKAIKIVPAPQKPEDFTLDQEPDTTITPENIFICDVCYADFDSEEDLRIHKDKENHWH